MQLIPLENEEQLKQISTAGDHQVIFKHNTGCSISNGVLHRLEQEPATIAGAGSIHVLDLHAYPALSQTIAGRFGVPHQSPQLLLIKDGRCIYHQWGYDISAAAAAKAAGH